MGVVLPLLVCSSYAQFLVRAPATLPGTGHDIQKADYANFEANLSRSAVFLEGRISGVYKVARDPVLVGVDRLYLLVTSTYLVPRQSEPQHIRGILVEPEANGDAPPLSVPLAAFAHVDWFVPPSGRQLHDTIAVEIPLPNPRLREYRLVLRLYGDSELAVAFFESERPISLSSR